MVEQILEKGYKPKDSGVVPEDWHIQQLNRLIENGWIIYHLDGNHGELYPTSEEFVDQGVPFLSANMITNGVIDFNKSKYLTENRAKQFTKGVAENGDILLAHNATVGPVAILETKLPYVILGTTLTSYRCKLNRINNQYLRYYMESYCFQRQLKSTMKQTTRNQVPITEQKNLFFVIPSAIEEQTAIAQILSDTDDLVNSLDRLIEKKKNIKQGAMQGLLTGRKRLPGDWKKSKSQKPSELGIIPEDWEVVNLGEISKITRLAGAEYTSVWREEKNGEIIALRGFNIGKNRIIDKDIVRISNKLSLSLDRSRLCKGDVVYPCVGSIGNAVVINENNKYHIQQNIARIIPSKKIDSTYLAYYLMGPRGHTEIWRFNATSSQPNVLVGSLRQYRVPLPKSLNEQQAIASVISEMDSEIEVLEHKRDKYQQLKIGMMQQLLTGRIRLKCKN